MTHFSNGASKVPNLGLNILNLSLGYAYTFKYQQAGYVEPIHIEKTPFFRNWKYTAIGIILRRKYSLQLGKTIQFMP